MPIDYSARIMVTDRTVRGIVARQMRNSLNKIMFVISVVNKLHGRE